MELFDEVFTLFYMYHLLCFTDFVPEQSTQNIIGYSAITTMFSHMLYFYIVLSYFFIKR